MLICHFAYAQTDRLESNRLIAMWSRWMQRTTTGDALPMLRNVTRSITTTHVHRASFTLRSASLLPPCLLHSHSILTSISLPRSFHSTVRTLAKNNDDDADVDEENDVDEEEEEFFPKVRDSLSRSHLTDIGDTMAEAKKSAPTHPHPRLPDAGPAGAVAGAIAGVVDRVSDNISGFAQGGVTAVQDLIARITGNDPAKVSPTGTSATRTQASRTRRAATAATDGVDDTARSVKSGATKTAKAAKSGAKGTATSAKKAVGATATTAKRATTTTARTAKASSKNTVKTAKRAATKTASAATTSR